MLWQKTLFVLMVFSVVQLLFLVINLTEDGKLGVEFVPQKITIKTNKVFCHNMP
jgi:hypothetical protein